MYDKNRKPAWKEQTNNRPNEFNISPIEVEVRSGDIEGALKVLKNKLSKDGILTELKNKRYGQSKGQYKRFKHREALKKLRKSRGKKARTRVDAKQKD